jgi:hypothetical protein
MQKFFIVGCPRSGTTMLQQALNRHSQIVIPPETSFFFLLGFRRKEQRWHLNRINTDLGINLPFPAGGLGDSRSIRELYEQMADLYLHRLGRPQVALFGDKSPEHLLRLTDIFHTFPDAKVILIYRDGRDVALSLTKVPWLFRDLDLNFSVWLHYYQKQRFWLNSPPPNLHVVKYEEVVTEREAELRKIVAFLGLDYEPQVAAGAGNQEGILEKEWAWKGQACAPITASRIGVWCRELSDCEVARLERWGGPALRALGYELVTGGAQPLPLLFFPRLYAKMLFWLAKQPGSRMAKEAVRQGVSRISECMRTVLIRST